MMDWIDIIVREKDDSFVISIKDNGINLILKISILLQTILITLKYWVLTLLF